MFLYLPNDGESPSEADRRISGEVFFPVKEQKLYFKNLEGKEGTLFEKALYSDAAFCVLTAFATHPPFDLKSMMVNQLDRNQGLVGAWAVDFVDKMSHPAFSTGDYLDEESTKAADVLVKDYVSIEQPRGKVDDLFVRKCGDNE